MDEKLNIVIKSYKDTLVKNATKAEIRIQKVLSHLNIKYDFQKPIKNPKTFYILDFLLYNEYEKIILEIDGGYHYTKKQKQKDATREKFLKGKGYSVIRLHNRFALTCKKEELVDILQKNTPPPLLKKKKY